MTNTDTSPAASTAADPVKPATPRALPTSYPLEPGQLSPDARRQVLEEAPEPTTDERERELARRRLLTQQGGLESAQGRLNVLRDKPDHPLGGAVSGWGCSEGSAEARP